MLLSVVIEIVLFAIVIGGSWYGYWKGLLSLALIPCKRIICLTLSMLFCKNIGKLIFEPIISDSLSNRINRSLANDNEFIPAFLPVEEFADQSTSRISTKVANLLSPVLAFALIFILSGILLSAVVAVLNTLFEKGFIGRINKIFGLLCATIISVAVAYFFAVTFNYILEFGVLGGVNDTESFSGGPLYRFFLDLHF